MTFLLGVVKFLSLFFHYLLLFFFLLSKAPCLHYLDVLLVVWLVFFYVKILFSAITAPRPEGMFVCVPKSGQFNREDPSGEKFSVRNNVKMGRVDP
jgi:hypothetical protein